MAPEIGAASATSSVRLQVEGLEGVAALHADRVVGALRPRLGAELGHHQREVRIQVAHLLQVERQVVEVLDPAVPAEVLVDPEHVELVVRELLGVVGAAVDVDRDRQRRVGVARDLLRAHEVALGHVGPVVGPRPELVGHRVRDHGRVVARREHRAPHRLPGAPPLERLAQHVGAAVALPDRRLAPDHDARPVEALQQALVEQVVRARDVGADLLQVRDDAVHVGGGQGRAVARHVLVDRRAGELDAPVVEVEHPVLDLHRAQPDAAPVDLLDGPAVAQRRSGRSTAPGPRASRAAALGRASTSCTRLRRAVWRGSRKRALGHPARRRAQPHLEGGRQHRRAGALEHPVDQQLGAAARGRPAAGHVGHRPEVAQVGAAGRDQVDRAHDPAPVPPALGQARVLAAVDHDDEPVRASGAHAASLERERGVGVDVLAQPPAVQEDGGGAPHALELDQPAEAARRLRARRS